MYKSIPNLICLLMSMILCGCATGYQPSGFTGGFESLRINDNYFGVSFSGNGYTSGERANDLALMRCSELAINHGYKYFSIVSDKDSVETSSVTTTVVNATPYGGIGVGITTPIFKPESVVHILCTDDIPVRFATRTLEARKTWEEVKRKYSLSAELSGKIDNIDQDSRFKPYNTFTHPSATSLANKLEASGHITIKGFNLDLNIPRKESIPSSVYHGNTWSYDISETEYFRALVRSLVKDGKYDHFEYRKTNTADRYGYDLIASFSQPVRLGVSWDHDSSQGVLRTIIDIDDKSSNAYRDGIRFGDKIRRVDGVDVIDDVAYVLNMRKRKPSDQVVVNLVRAGQLMDVTVELSPPESLK